jgi:hypothetical protein
MQEAGRLQGKSGRVRLPENNLLSGKMRDNRLWSSGSSSSGIVTVKPSPWRENPTDNHIFYSLFKIVWPETWLTPEIFTHCPVPKACRGQGIFGTGMVLPTHGAAPVIHETV